MMFHIGGFNQELGILHFILFDRDKFQEITYDELFKDKENSECIGVKQFPFLNPIPRMWMNNLEIMHVEI